MITPGLNRVNLLKMFVDDRDRVGTTILKELELCQGQIANLSQEYVRAHYLFYESLNIFSPFMRGFMSPLQIKERAIEMYNAEGMMKDRQKVAERVMNVFKEFYMRIGNIGSEGDKVFWSNLSNRTADLMTNIEKHMDVITTTDEGLMLSQDLTSREYRLVGGIADGKKMFIHQAVGTTYSVYKKDTRIDPETFDKNDLGGHILYEPVMYQLTRLPSGEYVGVYFPTSPESVKSRGE